MLTEGDGSTKPSSLLRTITILRSGSYCKHNPNPHPCIFWPFLIYSIDMTKLLEDAIDRLRQLPTSMQDSAARVLIMQLEEEPEPGDLAAIAEGRLGYERGEFASLDQLRHEMGIRNN
jgi:hypothetical protein